MRKPPSNIDEVSIVAHISKKTSGKYWFRMVSLHTVQKFRTDLSAGEPVVAHSSLQWARTIFATEL